MWRRAVFDVAFFIKVEDAAGEDEGVLRRAIDAAGAAISEAVAGMTSVAEHDEIRVELVAGKPSKGIEYGSIVWP